MESAQPSGLNLKLQGKNPDHKPVTADGTTSPRRGGYPNGSRDLGLAPGLRRLSACDRVGRRPEEPAGPRARQPPTCPFGRPRPSRRWRTSMRARDGDARRLLDTALRARLQSRGSSAGSSARVRQHAPARLGQAADAITRCGGSGIASLALSEPSVHGRRAGSPSRPDGEVGGTPHGARPPPPGRRIKKGKQLQIRRRLLLLGPTCLAPSRSSRGLKCRCGFAFGRCEPVV